MKRLLFMTYLTFLSFIVAKLLVKEKKSEDPLITRANAAIARSDFIISYFKGKQN